MSPYYANQLEGLNKSNDWIVHFLMGKAKGTGYTQFPETLESYYRSNIKAKIQWENDQNVLGVEKGSVIKGYFYVPRQYAYINGDRLSIGVTTTNAPYRNDYFTLRNLNLPVMVRRLIFI